MLEEKADGPGAVTRLLVEARGGDRAAFDRLLALAYDELRQIAARQLRFERPGHTLHATALVHEAYLKLAGAELDWQDRTHFLAIAARAMRHVLVDHARRRLAEKRGGGLARTTLSGKDLGVELRIEDLLALDEALERLDERQRRIVECRYFGGMTEQEVADLLGLSVRTVRREWVRARAWLYSSLYPDDR